MILDRNDLIIILIICISLIICCLVFDYIDLKNFKRCYETSFQDYICNKYLDY